MKSFILLLLAAVSVSAQSLLTDGSGAPVGACKAAAYINLPTGEHYSCVAGSWSLDAGGIVPSGRTVNGHALTGNISVTAADVNLGSASNTSDANKPVSTAQQAALDLKAPLASPTFTGTVSGVTAAMVGLGSATNTSDASKPVSTAQQTALDLKANLASPTFTGTVSGITATMVGLGNASNTSDANKPVSTAQQTALDLKLNVANIQYCFLAADQTVSSATLANMTGCSLSVTSGQKYFGRAVLFLSDSVAAEGVKLDFGGGSASATNFRAQAAGLDSALTIVMQVTGLSSAINAAVFTGSGATTVDFTFEPGSTGTFIPRIAQNTHSLGTLTLARGSIVQLTLVP